MTAEMKPSDPNASLLSDGQASALPTGEKAPRVKRGSFLLVSWAIWGAFSYPIASALILRILPPEARPPWASDLLLIVGLTILPTFLVAIFPWLSLAKNDHLNWSKKRTIFTVAAVSFLAFCLLMQTYGHEFLAKMSGSERWLASLPPILSTLGLIALLPAYFLFFDLLAGLATLSFFRHYVPSESLGSARRYCRPLGAAVGAVLAFMAFGVWGSTSREVVGVVGMFYVVAFISMFFTVRADIGTPVANWPKYTCGTLSYTKRALFVMFAWLLWGDFVFGMMQTVACGSILPLELDSLGASSMLMMIILSTIPRIFNFTVCPWVSYRSDRHRGRFGRRYPYIMITMPMLAGCLVLLGWSNDLTPILQHAIPWVGSFPPATITIAIMAVGILGFNFFDMFVGSVFWYLFNDVVPPQFLGRFMGLFRVVGGVAGMLFNGFIFGVSHTHFREIFTGIAILYVVGFTLMFLFVKEGKYEPPPPPVVEGKTWSDLWEFFLGIWRKFVQNWYQYTLTKQVLAVFVLVPLGLVIAGLAIPGALCYFIAYGVEVAVRVIRGRFSRKPEESKGGDLRAKSAVAEAFVNFSSQLITFGKGSFSHRFYWYFYLKDAAMMIAGATGMYTVFFSIKCMGLTRQELGDLGFWGAPIGLVATYFVSVYVDRWHPLRITAYYAVFGALGGWAAAVWIWVTLPTHVYWWIALLGGLVATFSSALQGATDIPLFMRVMPKTLYGQFCSANAMIRSFVGIFTSVLGAMFMDYLKNQWGDPNAYRYLFIWAWVFNIVYAVFVCLGYREWKRLGGDENYRPPAPWTKEGYEEVIDKVKSIPAKPRLVMASMWIGLIGTVVNIFMVLAFMCFMWQDGMSKSFWWYAIWFIPIKLVLTGFSIWQLLAVRRDTRAAVLGLPTKMGVPHHGVLLVGAIQGLIYFPVFWYQTIEMIKIKMEFEMIVFGIASLGSTAMGMVSVHVLRWLEKEPAGGMAAPVVPPNNSVATVA